jgi:hypothetical protein
MFALWYGTFMWLKAALVPAPASKMNTSPLPSSTMNPTQP